MSYLENEMNERERFEKWAKEQGIDVEKHFSLDDEYKFLATQRAWEGWQAASLPSTKMREAESLIPDPKYLISLSDLLQELKEDFDEDQQGYISCELESAQLHLMAEKIEAWKARVTLSGGESREESEVKRLKKALKSAIGMTGLKIATLLPSGEKVIEWTFGMRQSCNHPELFDELALTGKGEVGS